MKMMKKITAFILASCVAAGYLSGINVLAEDTEKYVFDETFEGKTGLVTNIGGISYSNVNSNVTVDVDELTGSEALKFTVGDSGYSMIIELGKNLSGKKYKVSFDFRAENHSRYVKRFAQPMNASSATENFSSIATNYIWYYELGKTGTNFKVASEKVADVMQNKYAKIEYIFDDVNRTFDLYRDNVLIADDQPYYRTGDNATSVNRLYFEFANDGTYNGTNSDGTESNAGVYWVDNIHAEEYVEVEPVKERFTFGEDFKGKTGNVTNIGGVSYSNVSSNITVDVDEFTGSEALKFVVADKNESIIIPFGETLSEGKYKVSFDFRAENHSRYVQRFAQPINTNSATETFPGMVAGYVWYYEEGKQPSNYTVKYEKVKDVFKNRYAKIEYIFDATNRTFDMYRDGVLIVNDQAYYRTGAAVADIQALWFVFGNNSSKNGPENNGTDTNNGVYWVDNIKAEQLQVEPVSVKSAKDLTSVDVEFLTPVADVTDMITIYKGEDEIPVSAKLSNDGLTVTLTPDSALDEYTSYKIVAKKGLTSTDSGTLELEEDAELAFTTPKKEDSNVVWAECFEDYDEGKKYWDFGNYNHSGIIEIDPTTNSKALKLVVDGDTNVSQLIKLPADKIPTEGKYRVSYSLRAKTPQKVDTTYANMSRFPNIINSTYGVDSTGGALLGANSPKNKYFYFISHTEHNGFASNMENSKDIYMDCTYIMDLDNKTYDAEAESGKISNYGMWGQSSGRIADIAGYWFELTPATGGNIGEYYIDNLIVEKEPVKVVSVTPENNSKILVSEKEMKIKFNMDISNSVESYIEIYNDSDVLEVDTDYTISFDEDSDELIITFKNLERYTEYTVVLMPGITAPNNTKTETDYIYTFTTGSEARFNAVKLYDDTNEYLSLADCAGKTVKAYADVTVADNADKVLVVAVKDVNGALKAVKIVKNEEFEGNVAETEIAVPADATATWKAEFMLWSGLDLLKPLSVKEIIGGEEVNVYVSNTSVNGDGSIENPFNSIENAIAFTNNCESKKKININISDGLYELEEPITINKNNISTDISLNLNGADDVKITTAKEYSLSEFSVAVDGRIRDEVKGKVLSLSLSENEINWKSLGVSGHGAVYLEREGIIAKASDVPILSFDSEVGKIARYPDAGFITVSEVIEAGDNPGRWSEPENSQYYVKPEDRHNPPIPMEFKVDVERVRAWENAEGMLVDGYWFYEWTDLALPVESVSDGVIKTKYPSAFSVKDGNRFYVFNLLEELDAPGEWFYDEKSETLFVYPPEGSDKVFLNTTPRNAIQLDNVSNISINNIHVQGVMGNGIYVKNSNNINISDCEVNNVTDIGIYVSGGKNAYVKNCTVYNTGTTGIAVSSGDRQTLAPANHVVDGCTVHNFGIIKKTYSGGVTLGGVGNTLKNSKIYDGEHLAISYYGNDHLIDNNEIYDVVKNVADSGVIYTGRSMVQRGTVISNNYIHDIKSDVANHIGVIGIYLDDQHSGQTIINNRIENFVGVGVFISGGRDNTVTGNTFKNVTGTAIRLNATGRATNLNDGILNLDVYGLDGTYPFTGPAYSKYPHMANILNDNPLDPKYNIIKNNSYQNVGKEIEVNPLTSAGSTITEEEMRQINEIE